MSGARLWTIARLELTQRVRTVSWFVLLGVFALILVGVTWLAFQSFSGTDDPGAGIYSTVVYITLLLVLLVSPTLSGNSINGDRESATLAPVQVTLATTGEVLLGKVLAAWITGLAFAVVAAPFLVVATLAGGVAPAMVGVSLLILVVEVAVIAAIGVGLSGVLARPLFSVAVTYLVVAALAVGTVIGFGLVGASMTSEVTVTTTMAEYDAQGNPVCRDGATECWDDPENWVCEDDVSTSTYTTPRFDRVWWLLSANPFVVLADATPIEFDSRGNPQDVFGFLKVGVRSAQLPPQTEWNDCESPRTPQETLDETVPSWFVGLGVQVLLAVAVLFWAYARTRIPAKALPPGTRVA